MYAIRSYYVHPAALNLLDQVLGADDVSTGGLGLGLLSYNFV